MQLFQKIEALPPAVKAQFKQNLQELAEISESSVLYWLKKDTADFTWAQTAIILEALGQKKPLKKGAQPVIPNSAFIYFMSDDYDYYYSTSFGIKPRQKANESTETPD